MGILRTCVITTQAVEKHVTLSRWLDATLAEPVALLSQRLLSRRHHHHDGYKGTRVSASTRQPLTRRAGPKGQFLPLPGGADRPLVRQGTCGRPLRCHGAPDQFTTGSYLLIVRYTTSWERKLFGVLRERKLNALPRHKRRAGCCRTRGCRERYDRSS